MEVLLRGRSRNWGSSEKHNGGDAHLFRTGCNSLTGYQMISSLSQPFQIGGAPSPGSPLTTLPTPTVAPPGAPSSGSTLTPTGTLWYLRADGGTATQCNGKTDHALAGATGTNCAFSNPQFLWANDVSGETAHWKIAGGDTVILRQGPYRIGYKGPNAGNSWGYCENNPHGCTMPPIPAGTASVHTKFLGENYANCTSKTQLHGGYGLNHIIDLTQTQHVDVACLEITDYASCSRLGVGNICARDFPLDDYTDLGIVSDATTSDINLIDLNIHGLGGAAVQGPIGGIVNVNHVRMAFNGGAGWNFDDGSDSPMGPGALANAQYLTVEWNGCNEEYPIAHTYPAGLCYDQAAGGWAYGDGIGTSDTQLSFNCDHCNFNHNTQDGFDLLHTSGSNITITNSTSYANEGQQFKIGPMSTVTFVNNVVVGNCNRMAQDIVGATPGYNANLHAPPNGDDITNSHGLCRADATSMSLAFKANGTYIFQNNTLLMYRDIAWSMSCSDSSGDCTNSNITFQNNITMGYHYPNGLNKQPVSLYNVNGTNDASYKHRDHNIYYNFRNSLCPAQFANETCVDPQLMSVPDLALNATWSMESIFDNLDMHLKTTSPAYQTGIAIPGFPNNFDGTPITIHPNMGAY